MAEFENEILSVTYVEDPLITYPGDYDWRIPCGGNEPSPACQRTVHIGIPPFQSPGVSIHSTNRCGIKEHDDELYLVTTLGLLDSFHTEDGRPNPLYENRCCCDLFVIVKQCGTLRLPHGERLKNFGSDTGEDEFGEVANCIRVPRWLCKEELPYPDEDHMLTFETWTDFADSTLKACYISLPPNASPDICGNEPPSFVFAPTCFYGCGGSWWIPIPEEVGFNWNDYQIKLIDFKETDIYDPNGITNPRICLELCGDCWTEYEPCYTCSTTGGQCLHQGCGGENNLMTAINYFCQPDVDGVPGCFSSLFGGWCEECFFKNAEYDGYTVATTPELYHSQYCGENHPGNLYTYSDNPCDHCGWYPYTQCGTCKGDPVLPPPPPPQCVSTGYIAVNSQEAGQFLDSPAPGTTANPEEDIGDGHSCYQKRAFQNTNPIVDEFTSRLSVSTTWVDGSCAQSPGDGWQLFDCTINAGFRDMGEEERIEEAIQRTKHYPEKIELNITLDHDLPDIETQVLVEFDSPQYVTQTQSNSNFDFAVSKPLRYLFSSDNCIDIDRHSASGSFATADVPKVRQAIYLGEHDEGDDRWSIWVAFSDLYSQSRSGFTARDFWSSYQVFAYCNCPKKNCRCLLPSKSIGSKQVASFTLRDDDNEQ